MKDTEIEDLYWEAVEEAQDDPTAEPLAWADILDDKLGLQGTVVFASDYGYTIQTADGTTYEGSC